MSTVIDDINVIGICEVHDEIYGDTEAYSDQGISKLNKWLDLNECTFYSRVRENFFMYDAIKQAQARGHYCVLVEDLS